MKYKFFGFIVFIFLFIPSFSFAYPDSYVFNNFLEGASPYIAKTSDYRLSENGLWETYKPALGESDVLGEGLVVSYSDDFMKGEQPITAVPLVNLSKYGANVNVELPSYGCCVVTCDGDIDGFLTSSPVYALSLGTTKPQDTITPFNDYTHTVTWSYSSMLLNDFSSIDDIKKIEYHSVNTYVYWDLINSNDKYLPFLNSNFFSLSIPSSSQTSSKTGSFSPYASTSYVYFIWNNTDVPVKIYTNTFSGTTVNLSRVTFQSVNWSFWSFGCSSTLGTSSKILNRVFAFPDIAGDIDVYTYMNRPLSGSTYYTQSFAYGVHINSTSLERVGSSDFYKLNIGSHLSVIRRLSSYFETETESIESVDGSHIPIFLKSAVRYIDSTAIQVQGGYINVNNYDELVKLLKDSGIGSADLTRVIELLDEINSGGEIGSQVAELIQIIESSHDEIIGDFDSQLPNFNAQFDQYKGFLSWSDDMLWLSTALNNLINFFLPAVVLAVIYFTINRILNGGG